MFSLRTTNAKRLKKIFDSINNLFESSLLEYTTGGIYLRTFDSSHICIINLELDASGFDQYTCHHDGVIGIHVNSFCLILSQGTNSNDIVSISLKDEVDEEKLEFTFHDSNTPMTITRYSMKLLQINQDCFDFSGDNYQCKITTPSRELSKIFKNLNQLGKNVDVNISINKQEAIFSAIGDELISSKVIIKPTTNDCYFFIDEPTSGSFSLYYLVLFLRAAVICENVSLFMKDDVIKIHFEISKDERLTFYLPGKINDF